MRVVNAFMAFWGGLALTRLIYSSLPFPPTRNSVFPIFLIFVPSVVFWSLNNLKEGLVYWSICHVFAGVIPSKSSNQSRRNFLLFIIGACLGSALRPHIIFFWVVSVVFVKAFQRRFWKWGIILLFVSPLFFGQVGKFIDFDSFEANFQRAEQKMKHLQFRATISTHPLPIRTTFDYGKGGPIPILSGAKSTLFRPILWRVTDLRTTVSAIEIWTMSLGIIFLWMRMTNTEWRWILRNPSIWVALLVLIPFFIFITYLPNEGMIARQRVQVFPALLVLFAAPILARKSLRNGHKIHAPGADLEELKNGVHDQGSACN